MTQHTAQSSLPVWLTLLFATACGLIVANIYYAQPLIGPIAASLGVSPQAAGLIVTMGQIGYGVGLLLVVPLADLFENKRLILYNLGLCVVALVCAGLSTQAMPFLVAALFIGLGSCAVQIIVPFAAHLTPAAMRGQVIGNVMSGLMLGIMLARPVASFLTQLSSWPTIFFVSAGCMVLLLILLARVLPERVPTSTLSYGSLIGSMLRLMVTEPVLRRRALYHGCLFGAFSLFWTTVPLLLAGPLFNLSQAGIALFALAGVSGAIAAPLTGRIADKGWSRPATIFAMLAVACAFLLTEFIELGSSYSLAWLVVAAIVLDFGVSANLALGQRAIFLLPAEYRSRLNGVFMATFFVGGALGSGVGAWGFAQGGWALSAWIGFCLPVAALLYSATERR
ncbi:MAG: MFS transporter [Alcaligenaceae bacterium]